ncbi:hypothetical protein [Limnoglobus roseus]|uniref:Uncharacterized protein n=1 Tax=Limnoglobus roseus TaxID=2598579 RepID=A0A5C1APM0_9BACT|nr:hypothetical protein [Limnoglobus roseus]QEL20950.1 hypothetical protein PX52LOC_08078 [Limnoglobus roseus]
MKQICPECLKSVEVPDSAAGTDVPCPVCGAKIPVPGRYSPAVAVPPPAANDAPPPPPGLIPPASASPLPGPAVTPYPAITGDGKDVGVTLTPAVVEWIVPVGLTLIFVLTFFTWVGAYPGGHRLFAQNAWDTLFREISPNMVPVTMKDEETKLRALAGRDWPVMLPYLVLLIVSVLLAWGEKFVHEIDPVTVPGPLAWLSKVWPQRFLILAVLCGVLLGFFVLEMTRGFGLETAVRQYAVQKYETDAAAADTQLEKVAVQVKTGGEQGRFAVQTTTWYALAFLAHVVVVLAILIRMWLANRPGKAYPRLALRY